jgi:hypothetical protein
VSAAPSAAFGPTINPSAYVPYEAAERALEQLEIWAYGSGRSAIVLRGAAGMGKTMLMKVFAARTGDRFVTAYVPNPDVDPDGLCRWVLEALGRSTEEAPRPALAHAAQEIAASGRELLLLVDDAGSLPPRTEVWLFDFARRSGGAVRLVLALADERLAADLAGAFGTDAAIVPLDTPMSRVESDAYVRSELARAAAGPALRGRFDEATLAAIHVRAGGVPARIKQEAAAVITRAAREPAAAAVRARPPERPLGPVAPLRPEAGEGAAAVELPGTFRPAPVMRPVRTAEEGASLAPPRSPAAATRPAERAEPTPTPFRRRESARPALLRWLLSPLALAASFAAGFVAAHAIEVLRITLPAVPAPVAAEAPAAREGIGSAATAPSGAPGVPVRPPLPAEVAAPAAAPAGPSPGVAAAETFPSEARAEAAPSVGSAADPRLEPGVERARAPFAQGVETAPGPGPLVAEGVEAAPGVEPGAEIAEAPAGAVQSTPRGVDEAPAVAVPAGEPPAPSPTAALPTPPATRAETPTAEPGLPDVAAPPPAALAEPGEAATRRTAAAAQPTPTRRSPARRSAAATGSGAAARRAERDVLVSVSAALGSEITIDGISAGSAPIAAMPLSPGLHRISARLPDGREIEQVIEVRGTRYQVTIR